MKIRNRSQSRTSIDTQTDTDGVAETDAETDDSRDQRRTADDLSLDIVFEILKNSRRREVIRYLREQEERVSLGEMAEHIAAIENGTTVEALTSSQRKRVYVGLYQCHLPKMDDVGVVEFDQNRGHVQLTDRADTFEKYLDASTTGHQTRWYRYYTGVSALGGVGLLTFLLFSPPAWLMFGYLALVVTLAMATSVLQWSRESDQGPRE